VRGFRDAFLAYTPVWLQNRQDYVSGTLKNAAARMLYSMIFPLDVAVQTILEGLKAAFPGIGTSSALPILGQARGLLQGEGESNAAFALRLINWLTTWQQSVNADGSGVGAFADEQMARQIQAYLGNTPTVRVVDRSGQWVTVDPTGVATRAVAAWNWDGTSNPERAAYWSDIWIIVYPCEWTQAPNFQTRKAAPHTQGYGVGALVQRTASDAILSIVSTWKGKHTTVRAIVWSYDATLCVPGGSNNPDGNWGEWSKLSGGHGGTRIPARSANARYTVPLTL